MICPTCRGKKIIEIMGGVIIKRCETCKGKGEIDNNPEYLILSERMGKGESLNELAEKAHEIIESVKGKRYDSISGTGQDNSTLGTRDTSIASKKRKPRKATAKRVG